MESKLTSVFIAAEPDLLIEMRSAANLPAGWPDDSRYQKQDASGKGNFPHQKIGRAWNLIHNNRGGSNTQIKIGHPGIYVASLDEGINPGAQEVKCNAEDATAVVPKLGCYDVRDSLYCDDPRYDKPTRPEEAHGMAVFGLISACTNNNKKQIAGIAPGSHHIAIKRPLYTSTVDYGNVLLWLGGFPPQPHAVCAARGLAAPRRTRSIIDAQVNRASGPWFCRPDFDHTRVPPGIPAGTGLLADRCRGERRWGAAGCRRR